MNPSGQPFPSQFGGAPPPSSGGPQREALNVPGILFMVFGGLGVLYSLVGLVSSGDQAQFAEVLNNPDIPLEVKEAIKEAIVVLVGPLSKVFGALGVAIAAVLVFAGVQMRNLKNYGLAIVACVFGILPCTGCTCCLTLPLAIWTLTILTRPEIKSSFT